MTNLSNPCKKLIFLLKLLKPSFSSGFFKAMFDETGGYMIYYYPDYYIS